MNPMTETVIQETKRTEAVDAYLKEVKATQGLRTDEPVWLAERRKAALETFRDYGVPHPKLEAWRQTNLGPLRSTAWPVVGESGRTTPQDIAPFLLEGAAAVAVTVDGHPVRALSRLALPDGAKLLTINDALATCPDLVEPHLAKVVAHDGPEESLRALNTAAFIDGWFLHLPRGVTLPGPVHLLHVTTGRTQPFSVHPRLLVVAGETAEAMVVESFDALAEGRYHVNAVTELVLGQSAVLDHVKLQRESLQAYHTAACTALEGRDSKLRDLSIAVGAHVSRYDLATRLRQGSEVHMNGLYLGKGDQVLDHHTWIDHAEPHATSIELYKGVLDGKAHGVFTGNVLVREDAQKTNSAQENRNLILSDKALVDTTPQLEIHADDVKCAHGTTIGQLPKDQIFYLRTRGFTLEEAKRVITEAFAAEVLEVLDPGPLRTSVEALVADWFTKRQEAVV